MQYSILTPGSVPEDYHQVLDWRLADKPVRFFALQILSALLFIIFGLFFVKLAASFGKMPLYIELGLAEISAMLAGVLLTFILHELLHGLTMQILGAKPQYGILWKKMMLYATSPGHAYRRNDYVGIALAPLVVISILTILGMWFLEETPWVALLGLCGAINASGAIGDIWITMLVLRYAATAYVVDQRDGVQVFLPRPDIPSS